MRFKDQVAVVTGGARGIGRAIALAFVGEGAKVALVDIDSEHLERLREEIVTRGGQALSVSCDISKSSDVKEMMDRVLKTFGRIDVLVNNAGIIRRADVVETTEDEWARVMAVNVTSVFLMSKHAIPVMAAASSNFSRVSIGRTNLPKSCGAISSSGSAPVSAIAARKPCTLSTGLSNSIGRHAQEPSLFTLR